MPAVAQVNEVSVYTHIQVAFNGGGSANGETSTPAPATTETNVVAAVDSVKITANTETQLTVSV